MSPGFDPQQIYTDAVNQAKSQSSTALLLGALLMAGVMLVVFSGGRRR